MMNKKSSNKLVLNKKTISNLTRVNLDSLKGGAGLGTETLNPSFWPTCHVSAQCVTFCLGNCPSEGICP